MSDSIILDVKEGQERWNGLNTEGRVIMWVWRGKKKKRGKRRELGRVRKK